jgi:hypothetical protein
VIELQQRYLEAVRHADSPAVLRESVQHAIELEFATLPPYLTAMMSLQPDTNSEIRQLVALGGTPTIASPQFVPTYPGPLPMCVDSGLIVGLERFSMDLVQRMFMEIEHPEDPLEFPTVAEVPSFATIGEFYAALMTKLTEIGDSAFCADPGGQLLDNTGFPPSRIFPIVDVASAARAIDVIVREGEGTRTSPLEGGGEVAHYYRFEQIVRGRTLVADSTVPQGFSFTGSAVPFDSSGVFPITANQRLADLNAQSQAGQLALQFARTFTDMLTALHETFAGDQDAFGPAVGLMFELESVGEQLCATEVVVNGQPTGRNAGPTWEFLSPGVASTSPPVRHAEA